MADHGPITRVTFAVLGGLLLLVGIALLVLPGPGLLLVFAGMVLLARAVPAFERFVAPVRARALQASRESVASPVRIAGTALAGLLLMAAGVVWALVPQLPFSGWSSGSSLILAGLILWAILVWSHRQHRHERPAAQYEAGEGRVQ